MPGLRAVYLLSYLGLPTCRDSMEGHYGYIVDLDTCFPQGDGAKNCFGGGGRFSVYSLGA